MSKNFKFASLVVIVVILLNVAYTGGVLFLMYNGISEPTTLTISWFAFTTTELLAIAKIKIDKIKNNNGGN